MTLECPDVTTFSEKLVQFIKSRQHVSFVEIENFAEREGFPVKGEMAISPGGNDTIVYWVNLSDELMNCLQSLHREKKIFFHTSTTFIYCIDGRVLTLPVATQNRRYKTDHWLPVTVCTHRQK